MPSSPISELARGRSPSFWGRLNWTDQMLAGWYLVLGIALLFRSRSVQAGSPYLLQHIVVLGVIVFFATFSNLGRWWRFAHDWYPMFVFIAAFEEISRLSLVFTSHWQDPLILHAEASVFPIPPTVWLRHFQGFWVTELLEFGYFTFYWIMPAVGGVLYVSLWSARSQSEANNSAQPFRVWMDATVFGYVVCYLTYLLAPTEGPAHTLPPQALSHVSAGPFHWLVLLIQHHAGVHGNAFPSGHIMASFVALLAAVRWRPTLAKWLVAPVLLMCVGAVYDGYHYASDVVAGAIVGILAFLIVSSIRRDNPAIVS